jgi:hypothetical protein
MWSLHIYNAFVCFVFHYSLEQETSKCAAVGNMERHRELTEKMRQQHELLDAEKKVCNSVALFCSCDCP